MHIYLIFKTNETVNESRQYLKKIDQVVFLLCHILKIIFADIVIKVKDHPQHTLKAIVYLHIEIVIRSKQVIKLFTMQQIQTLQPIFTGVEAFEIINFCLKKYNKMKLT